MDKSGIEKDLKRGKGVLAKHITWGMYLLLDDGSIGHCYAGRINPKTAESLILANEEYGAEYYRDKLKKEHKK